MVRFATKGEKIETSDTRLPIPPKAEPWLYRDEQHDITVLLAHYDNGHLSEISLRYPVNSAWDINEKSRLKNISSTIITRRDVENNKIYRIIKFACNQQETNEPDARAVIGMLNFYEHLKEGLYGDSVKRLNFQNELKKNFEVRGNLNDIIYGHLGYTKPLELKPR